MKTFVRMFKPQFARLVEQGLKLQTVRPVPKRMPQIGDKISLREWLGKPYRSKQRVLRESVITYVASIYVTHFEIYIPSITSPIAPHAINCERFAVDDGFSSFFEMCEWFESQHGLPFEGIVIYWT